MGQMLAGPGSFPVIMTVSREPASSWRRLLEGLGGSVYGCCGASGCQPRTDLPACQQRPGCPWFLHARLICFLEPIMRPTREFNAHMGQLPQDPRLCELKTPLGKDVLVFV